MPVFSSHAPGTFCWADMGTTDPAAAKKFYASLFGWVADDVPMGTDEFYTMFKKGDKYTCALFGQRPEQREAGVPPAWNAYLASPNVDAAAAKAVALGGAVAMAPFDVFDAGRMVYVQDPTGAHIALWQAKSHIGAAVKGEHGALSWIELMTTDLGKARAFYQGLVGWTTRSTDMGGGMEYVLCDAGKTETAGMMARDPKWGDVPIAWTVYFHVDDTAASAPQAASLGATILTPPQAIPGVGVFAIVRDPQGATFGLIDNRK